MESQHDFNDSMSKQKRVLLHTSMYRPSLRLENLEGEIASELTTFNNLVLLETLCSSSTSTRSPWKITQHLQW
jgi:hypothetical protein